MARMPQVVVTDQSAQPAQPAETNPDLASLATNATNQPIQPAQAGPEHSNPPAVDTDSSAQEQTSQAQPTSGAQQHAPSEGPSNLAPLHQYYGLPSPLPSIAPVQGAPSSSFLLRLSASIPGTSDTVTPSVQLGFPAPLDAAQGSNNHQVPPSSSALAQPPLIMPTVAPAAFSPAHVGSQAQAVAAAAPTGTFNHGNPGMGTHSCAVCNEAFRLASELRHHREQSGHYLCSRYGLRFDSRAALNRHLYFRGHWTRPARGR